MFDHCWFGNQYTCTYTHIILKVKKLFQSQHRCLLGPFTCYALVKLFVPALGLFLFLTNVHVVLFGLSFGINRWCHISWLHWNVPYMANGYAPFWLLANKNAVCFHSKQIDGNPRHNVEFLCTDQGISPSLRMNSVIRYSANLQHYQMGVILPTEKGFSSGHLA